MDLYGKQKSYTYFTMDGVKIHLGFKEADELGRCMEYIESIENTAIRDIARAEYCYFSGRHEEAVNRVRSYLNDKNIYIRLSASLIYAYANFSLGDIKAAGYAQEKVKNALQEDNNAEIKVGAAEAFISMTASVLLHMPIPEGIPDFEEFTPALPPGIRLFALYIKEHYLYLKGEYERSLGVVDAALGMGIGEFPIPAIYMNLIAVMDNISLRRREKAEGHLMAAWRTAQPDDLIEAFGEHHGLLGGMLESVIKPEWPEDFKRIIDITYRFSAGWRKVHNPMTGHDMADDLTTTEFAVAMLAARGWTNQEIAQHMKISAHTVKAHVSAALQKLGVRQRRDLKKYMLK